MKRFIVVGALLLSAAAGFSQESRQDVSLSATGNFYPFVSGTGGNKQSATVGIGFLGSYRYLLTPRSALEANYSFTQHDTRLFNPNINGRVHTRQQEFSLGYVYSLNFRNFNPFVEAGPAAIFFSPLHDFGTTLLDTKRTTGIGAMFGAGLAYELSPSFDVRVEYRGFAVKAPSFGAGGDAFNPNRYEVISMPTVGLAYHF